jgi:hypothetical protein
MILQVEVSAFDKTQEIRGSCQNIEMKTSVEEINGEAQHDAQSNCKVIKGAVMHFKDCCIGF